MTSATSVNAGEMRGLAARIVAGEYESRDGRDDGLLVAAMLYLAAVGMQADKAAFLELAGWVWEQQP